MTTTEAPPAVEFGPWIEADGCEAYLLPQEYLTCLIRTRDCGMQTAFRVRAYSMGEDGTPFVSGSNWLRTGDMQIVKPTHFAKPTHFSGTRMPIG